MPGFYSTKDRKLRIPLEQAIFSNLASDGGLYMPEAIPALPADVLGATNIPLKALSLEVLKRLLGNVIPEKDLRGMIDRAFNFDAPLKSLTEKLYVLELFHGPTCAFKDFGVRFMAELVSYFSARKKTTLTILTATSGDTGGAVASAFYNVPNTRAVILYPKDKVSDIQEKQIAALGGNIHAYRVNGTFDDCQRLVKQAFLDKEIIDKLSPCSANSINIARLIPQVCYYVRAWTQLADQNGPLVVAVPSGNFGNLTAGVIAKKMGVPINLFVAATNMNDIVPRYLESGRYEVKPFVETLANAMDIADPSNFVRVLDLYGNDLAALNKLVTGMRATDQQTEECIRELNTQFRYVADPHTAIAYFGVREEDKLPSDCNRIFLATAHPAKFCETVERVLGTHVEIPMKMESLVKAKVVASQLSQNFGDLKAALLALS